MLIFGDLKSLPETRKNSPNVFLLPTLQMHRSFSTLPTPVSEHTTLFFSITDHVGALDEVPFACNYVVI
jgi:hypothetical protein